MREHGRRVKGWSDMKRDAVAGQGISDKDDGARDALLCEQR